MLPLFDDNTDRHRTPYVNYLIIVLNILVFVVFQGLGANEQFTGAFATIPKEILTGQDIQGPVSVTDALGRHLGDITLQPTPISVYLTVFSSMFMHGGLAHIGGNMLYLWIFGDNLENDMGHFRYLLFYLLCGVAADLAHVFTCAALDPQSMVIPTLGASGAISGVMGGYILLHPHRKVTVIMFRQLVNVPAYVALGSWIFFQLIDSLGWLGGAGSGGVAYAAHIGGFIAGLLLVKLFTLGTQPAPASRRNQARW